MMDHLNNQFLYPSTINSDPNPLRSDLLIFILSTKLLSYRFSSATAVPPHSSSSVYFIQPSRVRRDNTNGFGPTRHSVLHPGPRLTVIIIINSSVLPHPLLYSPALVFTSYRMPVSLLTHHVKPFPEPHRSHLHSTSLPWLGHLITHSAFPGVRLSTCRTSQRLAPETHQHRFPICRSRPVR